jgi:hypothetical protein
MSLIDQLNQLDPEVKWIYHDNNFFTSHFDTNLDEYVAKHFPFHLWVYISIANEVTGVTGVSRCGIELKSIDQFIDMKKVEKEPPISFSRFKKSINTFDIIQFWKIDCEALTYDEYQFSLKQGNPSSLFGMYPKELIDRIQIRGNRLTIKVSDLYYFRDYNCENFPVYPLLQHQKIVGLQEHISSLLLNNNNNLWEWKLDGSILKLNRPPTSHVYTSSVNEYIQKLIEILPIETKFDTSSSVCLLNPFEIYDLLWDQENINPLRIITLHSVCEYLLPKVIISIISSYISTKDVTKEHLLRIKEVHDLN